MTQSQSDEVCKTIKEKVMAKYMENAKRALDIAGPNGVICFQVDASPYPDLVKFGPEGATQVKLELYMHTIANVRGGEMKCVYPPAAVLPRATP